MNLANPKNSAQTRFNVGVMTIGEGFCLFWPHSPQLEIRSRGSTHQKEEPSCLRIVDPCDLLNKTSCFLLVFSRKSLTAVSRQAGTVQWAIQQTKPSVVGHISRTFRKIEGAQCRFSCKSQFLGQGIWAQMPRQAIPSRSF